ncbi:opioid growth factor receptor isoform X2 [Varanus komodoensis]|uniref:opioid growth factor receptor isoform X2 n=1 Tax=Varanus komodoensis TaxID=61221 RepID=UPI001CF7B6C7|nr:opioid growth factor receptor isoform X2 [Varanus komodoensis]
MATPQPSPSLRGTEAEQENEEEEEEAEEEEEEWCGEYDSTWEDDEEEEEEEEEEGGQLEEDPGRKNSEAANPPAETEEAKPQEKPGRRSPGPKRASGFQIFNRLLFQNITKALTRFKDWPSFPLFGTCKSASRQNWMAARDMQKYRHRYPGLEETERSEDDMWNLSFYKNEINFLPRGLYIEDLLETWQNDYSTLEENHSYIQWLFPLREQGMNFRARVLTCQEIEAFRKSKPVMERFVRAYKLMLRFYGISLINEETGELNRAENWRERFDNLNRYSHNNLRITRILKCLGEMGYEHYQVHLVKFFLTETLVNQELPRVLRSTLDYFMFTVRNKRRRRELVHFAWRHFRPRRDFVWGPHKKLRKFKPRSPEFLHDQQLQRDLEPGQKGAGEALGTDDARSPEEVSQRLGEESAWKGAGEAVGKDTAEMQNLTDGVINHDPVGQPVSTASSETGISHNDSAPDTVDKKEPSVSREGDGLQAGGATESQTVLVSECKTSEKAEQPSPTSVGEANAEDGVQKGTPGSLPQLEKEDPVGECGSGIDSESLKESKKRKLEMSRLFGESAGLPKGPSDIEKISLNLEEVVIGQKLLDSHLSTEKTANPGGLAGGSEDHRDEKEPDLANAVAKRRKVEETPEGESACKTPEKVGVEVAAPEGQIANCVVPTLARTGQVGQDGAEMLPDASVHTVTKRASASVDPLVNPTTSSEPGQPWGSGAPDKTEGQQTASAVGSVGPQPCGTLPADEQAVERLGEGEAGGVEEKTEAAAAGREAPKAAENQDSQVQPKEGE